MGDRADRRAREGRRRSARADPARSAARTSARCSRCYLAGKTQREIATELGMSLGVVNKRIVEGTNYLVLIQSIEAGLA